MWAKLDATSTSSSQPSAPVPLRWRGTPRGLPDDSGPSPRRSGKPKRGQMDKMPLDEMRLIDVGNIRCACGLAYFSALTTEGPTLWPQSSPLGFSHTPLDSDTCIR